MFYKLIFILLANSVSGNPDQIENHRKLTDKLNLQFKLTKLNQQLNKLVPKETFISQNEQPKYDEVLAAKLLHLAAAAYADASEDAKRPITAAEAKTACLKKAFPDQDWELLGDAKVECDRFKNTCHYYSVVSKVHKEIVVIFQGTKNYRQLSLEIIGGILKDFKKFDTIGEVHTYFHNAITALWPSVESDLNKYKEFKVTFTGHSLGGALASLASVLTVHERGPKLPPLRSSEQVRLYTFGQPCVGKYGYAFMHNLLVPNSFRIVHGKDFVPHLNGCYRFHQGFYARSLTRDQSKQTDTNEKVEQQRSERQLSLGRILSSKKVNEERKIEGSNWRNKVAPNLKQISRLNDEKENQLLRSTSMNTKSVKTGGVPICYNDGIEVWYPVNSKSVKHEICGPVLEDPEGCSGKVDFGFSNGYGKVIMNLSTHIGDHRTYFGKVVSAFGKQGCSEENIVGNWNK